MQNFMDCHNLVYFLFCSIHVHNLSNSVVYFVISVFIGIPLSEIQVLLVVF